MKLAGLLALGFLSLSDVVRAEVLPVDRNKAWFEPTLTADSAPVCADILRVERDIFFAAHDRDAAIYADLQLMDKYAESYSDPQVEIIRTGFDQQWRLTRPNGQRVFVKRMRFPGCGGGCESERMRIADKQFDATEPYHEQETSPGTPRASDWNLYKGSDGEFYALGIVDHDRLEAYRLASGAGAGLVCEVPLKPDKLSDHEDPAIRRAWQSVEALNRAYGSVTQGAGNCGSLKSHWRIRQSAERAMQATLYRPWRPGDRTDIPAVSVDQQLQMWALGGIAEYRTWQRYRSQVQRTVNDLAALYGQKFGWSEMDAKEAAARTLQGALATGFSFNSYYDYDVASGDRPLRRAILERQPLAAIKQYEVGKSSLDPNNKRDDYDNLLNVAIEYPEALQYLLSEGLDPNTANAFGKTPLMYAAQYNQLESVRILLAAGADPNAATDLPEDNCYYTLSTSGMTPLHYAARYAGAALIRLLVTEGAATFSHSATPLDWLNKYTDPASTERNPHLGLSEIPALTKLLAVPGYLDRQQTSTRLTTRAQAEYGRGEYRRAYQHLKAALVVQPDNAKALADLPLMAEKVGELDEAIPAAQSAIESATSVPMRAAAWFNLGLLCTGSNVFTEEHCDPDWIQPFIQAWKLQPTAARTNKLKDILNFGGGACISGGVNIHQRVRALPTGPAASRVQRIYVLHRLADPMEISPDQLKLVDRLTLDDVAITVLEGSAGGPLPRINGNPCTMPKN